METDRWKVSAVTSLAAAMVAVWLAVAFPGYVSPGIAYLCAAVFAVDAYAKWTSSPLRRYTTILFSFANAALIFAGFKFAGEPFSDWFAYLWILDGILKFPGVDTAWEGRFRHALSSLNTLLFGLTLLFGVRVFGSSLLSIVLGFAVLCDAWVKIAYLRDHHFVV